MILFIFNTVLKKLLVHSLTCWILGSTLDPWTGTIWFWFPCIYHMWIIEVTEVSGGLLVCDRVVCHQSHMWPTLFVPLWLVHPPLIHTWPLFLIVVVWLRSFHLIWWHVVMSCVLQETYRLMFIYPIINRSRLLVVQFFVQSTCSTRQ